MDVLAASGDADGWMGFLVVLGLGLAVVFLYRSMTKHLRRVPRSFDEPADEPSVEPEGNGTDTDAPLR